MRFLRLAALALDKLIARGADSLEFTRGRVAPGSLTASVWPRLTADLAGQLKRGTILFTGVNGKTTSGHFLSSILRQAGHVPLHTVQGSGTLEEISACLIEATTLVGEISADYGVFGCDEDLLRSAVEACVPTIISLNNLYPDGIVYPGGAEGVAREWQRLFATMSPRQTLLINADDPILCSSFTRSVPPLLVYFGVEDEKLKVDGPLTRVPRCARCQNRITYRLVCLSHLGDYTCETCGWERPMPTVYAVHVDAGPDESRFRIITPVGPIDVRLKIPGLHSIYNAVAAAAAALTLNIAPAVIRRGLELITPMAGRNELLTISNRQAQVSLIKNPTSLNEALRTSLRGRTSGRYLFLVDEVIENGFDLSWIWEANLTVLHGRTTSLYIAGSGAEHLALRIKHAGGEVTGVLPDVQEAFHHAMRNTPQKERLWVMATEAALFELRQDLITLGAIG